MEFRRSGAGFWTAYAGPGANYVGAVKGYGSSIVVRLTDEDLPLGTLERFCEGARQIKTDTHSVKEVGGRLYFTVN